MKTLNPACDIHLLNPLDRRHSAIDLQSEITNEIDAALFADIFFPPSRHDNNPFFRNAAATLLIGVFMFFIYQCSNRRWTFRDVVIVMSSLGTTRRLLGSRDDTKDYLEVLGDPETATNVQATIATMMQPFKVVAACWEHAEGTISLREWINDSSILILTDSDQYESSLRPIYKAIITFVSQLINDSQLEYDKARTWLFMDEFPTLGNFTLAGGKNPLKNLFTKGRKRGASVVIAFQSWADMKESHGENYAETMMAQCHHFCFLRLNDPGTKEWASRYFDNQVLKTRKITKHRGGKRPRNEETETQEEKTRALVSPEKFGQLSNPVKIIKQELEAYYISNNIAYKSGYSSRQIAKGIIKPSKQVSGFDPAPDSWMKLQPWTPDDWERLGITHLMDDEFPD